MKVVVVGHLVEFAKNAVQVEGGGRCASPLLCAAGIQGPHTMDDGDDNQEQLSPHLLVQLASKWLENNSENKVLTNGARAPKDGKQTVNVLHEVLLVLLQTMTNLMKRQVSLTASSCPITQARTSEAPSVVNNHEAT
jgi:hypothetical protein